MRFIKSSSLHKYIITTALLTAMAPAYSSETDLGKVRDKVIERYGEGVQPNAFKKVISEIFRKIDHNGKGISQAEIDYSYKKNEALGRAKIVGRILSNDLNADGVVTKKEMKVLWEYKTKGRQPKSERAIQQNKKRYAKFVDEVFKYDPNQDGKIELNEYASLKWGEIPSARGFEFLELAKLLVELDPNKEDHLQKEEASNLLKIAFSTHEFKLSKYDQERYGKEPAEECKIPLPSAEAKVILFGGYGGESLSTSSIAGQDDETVTAEINIEKGEQKLYLALVAHENMIWRFTGATERIENITISGRKSHGQDKVVMAGATGVDKDKISFIANKECLGYFSKTDDRKAARTKLQATKLLGKEPDIFDAQYDIFKIAMPSMTSSSPKKSNDLSRLNDMNRFYPGGVVKVDSEKVVSIIEAEAYEVLPSQAGLSQLIDEKKIVRTGRDTYTIVEPIRYPAGLAGAHSVKFVLKKGVPEPVGDPAHSCVFFEETGKFNRKRCG